MNDSNTVNASSAARTPLDYLIDRIDSLNAGSGNDLVITCEDNSSDSACPSLDPRKGGAHFILSGVFLKQVSGTLVASFRVLGSGVLGNGRFRASVGVDGEVKTHEFTSNELGLIPDFIITTAYQLQKEDLVYTIPDIGEEP